MTIYDIIHGMNRSLADGMHTRSQCDCGRQSRRGNELCVLCLTDKMVDLGIDREYVEEWASKIAVARLMETRMIRNVRNRASKEK